MRNPLSLEAFADWLEQQPADKEYRWLDPCECAIGQYCRSLGMKGCAELSETAYFVLEGVDGARNHYIAMDRPRTFGAALRRARSAIASAE